MTSIVQQVCRRGVHCSSKLAQQSAVPLTQQMYKVERGQYATLKDYHLGQFESILDSARVITDQAQIEPHNIDWFKTLRGKSSVVLKPRTTAEVAAILRVCYENKLALCPQGGNTGVVGGGVPVFDEVVLSTSLMNKIININDLPGSIVCQAGCILETLDTELSKYDLMMPLDLGAKGSCHIGGNIATNAGGLRVLRYGSLQANTLGLVAVKADGEIVDCMNTLRKDNTGYHLKHLFIGSEGTLGIITEVAILCPPKPRSVSLAFLGVTNFEQALQSYRLARSMLAEVLSACEVIDKDSLHLVTSLLGLSSPLSEHPFYILIETSGSHSGHDEEKLHTFFEQAMDKGVVSDGLVTSEPSKMNKIWELRERIPEAMVSNYYSLMYDFTLPLEHYYQLVPELRQRLDQTPAFAVTGFGHLGDGNLHLNICSREYTPDLLAEIEPFVFKWVGERGGSISAEHGIGFKKANFLQYSKGEAAINNMKQIKKMMDSRGILNPYKVLPWD